MQNLAACQLVSTPDCDAIQVILYTFPAICWAYGAGFVFSAFVSVVFWGGPALRLLELVRMHSATVRPASLTPASEVHFVHCLLCNAVHRMLLSSILQGEQNEPNERPYE